MSKNQEWAKEIILALAKLGVANDTQIVKEIAARGTFNPYSVKNPEARVRATIQTFGKDYANYKSTNMSIFKKCEGGYSLNLEDCLHIPKDSWAYAIYMALIELGTANDQQIVDKIYARGYRNPYEIQHPEATVRSTIQDYSKDFSQYKPNHPSLFCQTDRGTYHIDLFQTLLH